jgi:hypothetical protein
VIVLCVRWYVTYKLSSRDLREMMAERGVEVAHTTILRWVQRYVPEFEKRWGVCAGPVGLSWRVDETYIKVKGRWTYLYRAGAPRNAVLNPPHNGEKFGGTLLGHPPYLNAKAGGDKSMAEKRGTPEGAYGVVLQDPRDTVKAKYNQESSDE